ncbi:MAG: putative thiosulfate sulfurtransferase [Candidatus Carbobacillus altaicus]|uniref:thiosulfate sulfurtransferase n=1 Tax=Candidatus Carbonibacillus altaicus TaxID=2163959 RepID=A0A2R6XXJ4_9BACL|nr:MAG: putative thiosulfate sulfurtransferase [Candidatus Carbobacillus altaicus]
MASTYFFRINMLQPEPLELPTRTDEGKELMWVDVRPYAAFLRGHLPGARWVDLSQWMVPLDTENDLDLFTLEIQRLYTRLALPGAGSDAVVVLYDQGLSPLLCRSAFILGLGGMDVMLWPAGWETMATETGEDALHPGNVERQNEYQNEVWTGYQSRHSTEDQLENQYDIDLPSVHLRRDWFLLGEEAAFHPNLIDVRMDKEFSGEMFAPCCSQGGRIDGARHIALSRFLEDLPQLLQDEPALKKEPLGLYCHSGARSAVAFFLLRERGIPVKNYFDSIHGWLRAGRPVIRGDLHEYRLMD